MTLPRTDNGDAFMRAAREAQRQVMNQYNAPFPGLNPRAWTGAPTPGERPEPEDTTGLKMLDEFLAKRKGARDD
jgi:hypothetical protein